MFALWLVGWELLLFMTIMFYGVNLLQLSPTPLDLILNVVALHFLHEIDDYKVQLAPGLGN